jgi:hypothetical protein
MIDALASALTGRYPVIATHGDGDGEIVQLEIDAV